MTISGTPRLDRTIELADGRHVGYAEWGDPRGRPVVLLHGQFGSRLLCPDEEATEEAGVRLITLDRPGYGRSDPCPLPNIGAWAADFAEVADRLDLIACPIVGWSMGGPYALAAAVGSPDRITTVGLAASTGPVRFIPDEWPFAPNWLRRAAQLPNDRPAVLAELEAANAWFAADPDALIEKFFTDPTDPDSRLVADPGIRSVLLAWFREGARQGSRGVVDDELAELDDWGFASGDVRQPVEIWWGDGDRMVARCNADYYAATIPNAKLTIYPNTGHLPPLTHWRSMLAGLTDSHTLTA